jgi:hypothetical protein
VSRSESAGVCESKLVRLGLGLNFNAKGDLEPIPIFASFILEPAQIGLARPNHSFYGVVSQRSIDFVSD